MSSCEARRGELRRGEAPSRSSRHHSLIPRRCSVHTPSPRHWLHPTPHMVLPSGSSSRALYSCVYAQILIADQDEWTPLGRHRQARAFMQRLPWHPCIACLHACLLRSLPTHVAPHLRAKCWPVFLTRGHACHPACMRPDRSTQLSLASARREHAEPCRDMPLGRTTCFRH